MNPWIRRPVPNRLSSAVFLAVAALAIASAVRVAAQSSSSKSSSGSGATSEVTDSSGAKTGFAIESEMLTYTAMDSEAAALACSLARNLGAADEKCTPRSMAGPAGGVVVMASPSSAVREFQLWRTDISTMTMLTLRAERYCPTGGERAATTSTSLTSQILSMFPAGQAFQFATALMATTAETSPLEGNILDQTLVNDVAGHLRALGVNIVIPDDYMPHSLNAIDEVHSPFLAKFSALLKARKCVEPAAEVESKDDAGQHDPAKDAAALQEEEKKPIAASIDTYLKSLTDTQVPAPKATTSTTSTTAAPAQPSISHLNAVLRADGLALELDAATRGDNAGWYVLALKALESGGTLLKSGNAILGTKTSYSGGAVGTYSMFHLSGAVVCSGVFYNYSGPLQTSKIPKLLSGEETIQPGKLVGGCGASE
jgi:hypothetical protein